ncbi:hypothetical protein NQ314_014712 [Rhamnusium bicolor]|uniref:Partial AB-hydrolase lipase domain-containing protein n=1 Tax=Rhamnusium bicolor TaxID=1586634 RepID=A0AAV8X1A8_9CUCU|nr:hypothetical protein NQ314_014712 [Rhamnusium bicolor]
MLEKKLFLNPISSQNLVEGFGYPFESHEVVSQSGYILSLHRIPNGIKRKQLNTTKRPVALFQHGLVAASDTWLFRGPDMDLHVNGQNE